MKKYRIKYFECAAASVIVLILTLFNALLFSVVSLQYSVFILFFGFGCAIGLGICSDIEATPPNKRKKLFKW